MPTVTYDDKKLQLRIGKLQKIISNSNVLLKAAVLVQNDVGKHFDNEEDSSGSRWQELSPVTLKLRRNKGAYKILQDTGRLRRIYYKVGLTSALVGTTVDYGKIHQYGGQTKMFGKAVVKIPRRQWLWVSDDCRNRIEATLAKEIKKV